MRKEDNKRIRWLPNEEATRLLQFLPTHLSAMAAFSLATGLRQSNVILSEGYFKERLEIIFINGNSLIGPHRCVVADRDKKSNINDLSNWKNATYIDTWRNEILSDKHLTSLTKEQFAAKGGVSGKVELLCMYRRQEKLSKNECIHLIQFLTEAKSLLTVSTSKSNSLK